MRHTLGSFKLTANWTATLNLSVTNPDWLIYLNRALERLMAPGMWVGTTGRYAISTQKACITWPRSFQTIEAMDICRQPIALRNWWYEFLEAGPGKTQVGGCASFGSIDRGFGHAMFDDLHVDSIIRLYPQYAVDVDKIVTIRGTDLNGNEVLTDNGDTQGEEMTLALPFVDSDTIWEPQVFREVIKAKTKGYVRAFAYDATLPPPPAVPGPNDTQLQPLAVWEPTETLPDYRRSFIPQIPSMGSGCSCHNPDGSIDTDIKLTVVAKHKFIPVEFDTDFLPIGNAPALQMAMRSCMLFERGDYDGARIAMQGTFDPIKRRYVEGAIPLLEEELDNFQGAGTVITLRKDPDRLGGAAVANFI